MPGERIAKSKLYNVAEMEGEEFPEAERRIQLAESGNTMYRTISAIPAIRIL